MQLQNFFNRSSYSVELNESTFESFKNDVFENAESFYISEMRHSDGKNIFRSIFVGYYFEQVFEDKSHSFEDIIDHFLENRPGIFGDAGKKPFDKRDGVRLAIRYLISKYIDLLNQKLSDFTELNAKWDLKGFDTIQKQTVKETSYLEKLLMGISEDKDSSDKEFLISSQVKSEVEQCL